MPQPTTAALTALSPQGIDKAGGRRRSRSETSPFPAVLETTTFDGTDPADVADQVDVARAKITGVKDPAHLLVVSSSDAGLAMPAAAWAARSGDPILFADGDEVPAGTMKVIKRHPNAPVFVLGPSSAISDVALKKLGSATRVGAEDPVENAIEFAKFTSGSFGWNINDPGHGFAIATTDRPLDAAAAAPLASSGGSPGPLLLTDDPATVPPALESFLSDTQPGYEDDPTRRRLQPRLDHRRQRGDLGPFQAQVDQLTKLAPVSTRPRYLPTSPFQVRPYAPTRRHRSRRSRRASVGPRRRPRPSRRRPPADGSGGDGSGGKPCAVEVGWRR